jgi:hypothetical protein
VAVADRFTVKSWDEFERTGRWSLVRRSLGVSSFGMNPVEIEPEGKIPEHDETERAQEEVFIVLEGTAAFVIDGEEHPAPTGTFARIDPEPNRREQMRDDGQGADRVGSGLERLRAAGLGLDQHRSLEREELPLPLQPACIADEASTRSHDAVAGNDDRDRVPVERSADRPRRARAADAVSEPAVGRRRAVRDALELLEHELLEGGQRGEVDNEVELAAAALEVLVELSPRLVERAWRPEHPGAVGPGEPLELGFRLRIEGDAANTALGGGDEKLADRGIGQVVGDVECAFCGGALPKGAVEAGGDSHVVLLLRRRTPEEAACRAASSLEPSAAAISA